MKITKNNNTDVIDRAGAEMHLPFFLQRAFYPLKASYWLKAFHLLRAFCFLIVVFISACSTAQQHQSAQHLSSNNELSQEVQILRDDKGTPHVFADSNYGVYFGYGYAVATDRLFQMEMLKRTVQGRVAEVLGDKFLSLDVLVRTSYDHRAVRQQLAVMSASDREILEGYAQGFSQRVNDVLANQQTLLAKEFAEYDFLPEAWTAYDVAMLFVGAIAHRYSDFNSELDSLKLLNQLTQKHNKQTAWDIFNSSKWVIDATSPTTVPRTKEGGLDNGSPRPDYLNFAQTTPATIRVVLNSDGKFFGTSNQPDAAKLQTTQLAQYGFTSPEYSPASNFWSVNKKLKGENDVKGVLVNGPQFGWGLPSYVYGIGLHGGDFNVVGNTLLGLPALLFAHNNYVGWGSTAGMSDQVDVFVETLAANNPESYLHNGKAKPFDSWEEIIKVRNAADVIVTARRSAHGMVVQMEVDNGVAYSRARAWEGAELDTLMAWVNLAKDRNLSEVRKRIGKVATNINFYYMDVKGNIGFTHGGRYPKRTKLHDSRLPVPGTGQFDWLGYRPYSDSPTVKNPEQGYIVNWNNRPAEDWIGSDLWPYTWSRADRSLHIFSELEAAIKLTVDQVWNINQSVSFDDVSGSFLLPFLQAAWLGEPSIQSSAAVRDSLQALTDWNKEWRIDQNGDYGAAELILDTWLIQLFADTIKDDVGDDNFAFYSATQNPNNSLGPSMSTSVGVKVLLRNLDFLVAGLKPDYDFFNGQNYQQVLRDSFAKAVSSIVNQYGEETSNWKLKAAPMRLLPYNFRGVPQTLETAFVAFPAYMNRGSENNLFSVDGKNFTAYDVIPPGQSGYIAMDGRRSKNYADQVELFSDFKTKPVPFSYEHVKKLATSNEIIFMNSNSGDNTKSPSTAVERVKSSLDEVERLRDSNAFIYIDADRALSAAQQADDMTSNGQSKGLLHGMPFVVKDNIHVAGMPNTAGTPSLKNFVPKQNNGVVQAMIDAGGIVLGKTNMHELAFGVTSNNAGFGAVANAHDPTMIAGGSSGGTGSAIGAGVVSIGLGTDTGGSTRIPAAINGVAGFRPSLGRYNSKNVTPISNTRDTVGPMATSVSDIALVDAVVTGSDLAEAASVGSIRLGVPRNDFYQNLDQEVGANIEMVLDQLRAAGITLIDVDLPGINELTEKIGFPIALYEVMQQLPEYLQQYTDVSFEQLVADIASPDVKGLIQNLLGDGAIPNEVYQAAIETHRPQLQTLYAEVFAQHDLDAIIMPTTVLPASPIDGSDETVELNGERVPTFPTYTRNTDASSNAGLPSLSIPSGKTDAGLPVAVLIDGPVDSDQRLLEVGLAIEGIIQ